MPFTFIHTADWQIGKSYGRFAGDVAATLRAARLEAIDRIAGVAQQAGAGHVLVAGDVIDSELIDDASLRQPIGRMAAYPALCWHLISGNHDPARRGGVWERLLVFGLPGNVRAHLTPAVEEIEPGVALLPAPLTTRMVHADPTAWMDAAVTPEGSLRIGLAHGSVRDFGGSGQASVRIDATRRDRAGLNYLALGDWHGLKQVGPCTWYSGTPEPDSFQDNGPGQVLIVRVAGPRAGAEVTPVATAMHMWRERRVRIGRLDDLLPVEEEVEAFGPERRRNVVSLILEGAIGAVDANRLEQWLDALAVKVLALDVDRRGLRVGVGAEDVAGLDDRALVAVADRLKQQASAADGSEGRTAARAMRLLLAYDLAVSKAGPTA